MSDDLWMQNFSAPPDPEQESTALISPCNPARSKPGLARNSSKGNAARESCSLQPLALCSATQVMPEEASTTAPGDTVFTHKGLRVAARMTHSHIVWKPTGRSRWMQAAPSLTKKLAYDEILSARHVTTTPCSCLGECSCLQVHQLVIFTFARQPGKPWVWRPLEHALACPQVETVREWAHKINAAVRLNPDRPQNLLVFLNPKSGRGGARGVWEGTALPLFKRAHIKCTVVETTRKDHARDMVAGMKADEVRGYQGVVAVGGDGLFQELLAGLLARRSQLPPGDPSAALLQRLRIGHIPAGSTDALACTLHGTRAAETAALHVALGDRTALDVMRLDAEGAPPCYSVCQAGYGFMGDVMQHSEGLRWMGPVRYDVSGALQWVQLRCYAATIAFLPAATPVAADRSRSCHHRCDVCRAASLTARTAPPAADRFPPFLPRPPSAASSSVSSPSGGGAAAAAAGGAAGGDAGSPGSSSGGSGGADASGAAAGAGAGAEEGWVVREGEWASIMCVVTPCRSDKSPAGVVATAHLADGSIYLVLVARCSRLQYLQFLLALSQTGVAPGQFPWVEVVAVTALRVQPGAGAGSRWNVDGELLAAGAVRASVCCGLVDVFGRGVEAPPPPDRPAAGK